MNPGFGINLPQSNFGYIQTPVTDPYDIGSIMDRLAPTEDEYLRSELAKQLPRMFAEGGPVDPAVEATVNPFCPAELKNFAPANTMLPPVLLMPDPLMSVKSSELTIVTSPVALRLPIAKGMLFFMFSPPMAETEVTVLMVLAV